MVENKEEDVVVEQVEEKEVKEKANAKKTKKEEALKKAAEATKAAEEAKIKADTRAVDLVLATIKGKYGDVVNPLSAGVGEIRTISTGSLSLDLALGRGGMALGRIYEVFGPPSSGKSTLGIHVVIQAQRRGMKCAYFDAEMAVDPELFEKYGVDPEKLDLIQVYGGEPNLDILERLIKTGLYDVIVIDSVSALIPMTEAEAGIEQNHMALQARLMSKALRKITPQAAETGTLLIFVNQIRKNLSAWGCFHYDTLVNFVDGRSIPIGEVVDKKIGGEVWTLNEKTMEYEANRIIGWHDNGEVESKGDFIHFQTESINGRGRFGFTCTTYHEIFTNTGLKKAIDITLKDKLISRHEDVVNGSKLNVDYIGIKKISIASDRQMRNKRKFDISVEGNHNYMVGGVSNGVVVHNSPDTTSGGESLAFYATGRISMRGPEAKARRIADSISGNIIGHLAEHEVVKNKLAEPFRKATLKLLYGKGYDFYWELIQMATSLNILEKAGAWYKLDGVSIGQGESGVVEKLKSDSEVFNKVRNDVMLLTGLQEVYVAHSNPGAIYPTENIPI